MHWYSTPNFEFAKIIIFLLVWLDRFKSSDELAAQLHESFIDRNLSFGTGHATEELNTTSNEQISECVTSFCQRRTVTLRQSCLLDLIYVFGCSSSVSEFGFNKASILYPKQSVQNARFHGGATSTCTLFLYLKETLLPATRTEYSKALLL